MKTITVTTGSNHFPLNVQNVKLSGSRMLGDQDCLYLETADGTKHWFPYNDITRLSEYDQPIEKTCDDMGPG